MKKVIFICMGNICRSPSAEAIMNYLIKKKGLNNKIRCDSAGTIGYHAGEPADSRMSIHASKRGYALTSTSRQFRPESDFEEFDYIVVMDDANLKDIRALDSTSSFRDKIYKMSGFCKEKKIDDVPDPYYGGNKGFETVLDILEDACTGLLDKLII